MLSAISARKVLRREDKRLFEIEEGKAYQQMSFSLAGIAV